MIILLQGCSTQLPSLGGKKSLKDMEVALQFLQEVIRTDKCEVLIGSAGAVFDAVLSYIGTIKYSVPTVQVTKPFFFNFLLPALFKAHSLQPKLFSVTQLSIKGVCFLENI